MYQEKMRGTDSFCQKNILNAKNIIVHSLFLFFLFGFVLSTEKCLIVFLYHAD